MDDVVTVAPFLKDAAPKMRPSMALSFTCFHCFNNGTPFGANVVVLAVAAVGLGVLLLEALLWVEEAALLLPLPMPPPKKPLNGLLFAPPVVVAFLTGCADCCFGCFWADPAPGVPPPKKLNAGRLFVSVATAAVFDRVAPLLEDCCFERLIVGVFLATDNGFGFDGVDFLL